MLDIDEGIYLYVIFFNLMVGGVLIGVGVGLNKIEIVVGIVKVYIIWVGEGLFLIELNDEIGDYICEIGYEYGIVIGCLWWVGWFDVVVMCYVCWVNGMIYLSLNLFDVLIGLKMIKIVWVYEFDG